MGVYGTFTNVDEYCLDFIPFDYDVLSLEMADAFKVSLYILLQNIKTFPIVYYNISLFLECALNIGWSISAIKYINVIGF